MSGFGVAVIADLVNSRLLPSRSTAQSNLVATFALVNAEVPNLSPLIPTVGDESQALYPDLASALRATLLVRLQLPEPLDCRFGIGFGEYQTVGENGIHPIQDGSAWWNARDAIIQAKDRESRQNRTLRTWFLTAEANVKSNVSNTPSVDRFSTGSSTALVNAYLLCRDELVTAMHGRSRRLLLGLLQGQTQVELAETEGITESAVSQRLRRNGSYAVLAGAEALEKEVKR